MAQVRVPVLTMAVVQSILRVCRILPPNACLHGESLGSLYEIILIDSFNSYRTASEESILFVSCLHKEGVC